MKCRICKKKISVLDKLDSEVRILNGNEYHKYCLGRLILRNAKDRKSVVGGKE